MGKDIELIYKYGQSQLSTSYLKAPVSSTLDTQTPKAIGLTTLSVLSVRNKNQCSVFPKYHPEWCKHKNYDDIQSCEIAKQIIASGPF